LAIVRELPERSVYNDNECQECDTFRDSQKAK
jgi:hypothetical protein